MYFKTFISFQFVFACVLALAIAEPQTVVDVTGASYTVPAPVNSYAYTAGAPVAYTAPIGYTAPFAYQSYNGRPLAYTYY